MKIVCIGGGPAGLYFAISMKRRDPGHDITIVERDPIGATYGWGVVFWDEMLDVLYRNDPDSAREITEGAVLWQEQDIRVGEETAHFGGYGFSIGRSELLDVLTRRATDLGVHIQHRKQVDDLAEFADADLIVVCDGAGSRLRQLHSAEFGTEVRMGENRYIWLGADKVFEHFTFAFEKTPAGWVWFHAYPSGTGISTCIVECRPQTWVELGFDAMDSTDSVAALEKIFEQALDGHKLIGQSRGEPARWSVFPEVTNESWCHGNVVLAGDAAHTTHFTLGSGTWLAVIDAIVLAQSLYDHPELPAALAAYDEQRRAELRAIQASARASMAWFEHVDRYLDRGAVSLAYAMSIRQGLQTPWRYQRYLAMQHAAVRRVSCALGAVRRFYLAARRGQIALSVGALTGRRGLPARPARDAERPRDRLGAVVSRAVGARGDPAGPIPLSPVAAAMHHRKTPPVGQEWAKTRTNRVD